MNYRRLICLVTAALSLLIAVSPAAAQGPDERPYLSVYASLTLQGFERPESADMFRGMQMALEAVNGRVGRFDIRLVQSDNVQTDVGRPTERSVAQNARRATQSSTSVAYIGEKGSEATSFAMPILNRAGVLQVSPTSTRTGLTTELGAAPNEPEVHFPTGIRSFVRIVPADDVQADALVKLMLSRKCRSVFIAHNGLGYGRGISVLVQSAAAKFGMLVVGDEAVSLDAVSYQPLAVRVRNSKANCFLYGGTSADNRAADIYEEVLTANENLQAFGPDGLADILFTSSVPNEIQPKITLTSPALVSSAYPAQASTFFFNFERQFATPPESYAINGYESMALVLDAIKRAGARLNSKNLAVRRKAVRDAAFATKNRNSVIGTYSVTPTGDTTLNRYGIYGVEGGALVYKGSLSG